MLAHCVSIGNHHPIVTVDEHLHKPAVDFFRVKLANEHKPAQHHQSLNVVTVSGFKNSANRIVDWRDAGCSVVETRRNFSRVVPMIRRSHFDAMILVGRPDEFSPTDDLSEKSFQRVDWHFILFRKRQRLFYNLLWCQ